MGRLAVLITMIATLAASAAQAKAPKAVPAEGEPFDAQLVGVDAQWQITLMAGENQRRVIPAADLAWWGTCSETSDSPLLVLADGGVVAARVIEVAKETLTAESDLLGTVKLPIESLAGLILHPPGRRADRDRLLDQILHPAGETDRVLLDNGDELTGLIETIQNDKVSVKTDAGPRQVETRPIVALIFNPALRKKPSDRELRVWVGLSDGSRLHTQRLVVEQASAELTTVEGQTWKTATKEIVFLQPLGGRTVYLSALKPAEYHYVPYLDLTWSYHANRNVTGGLLRCGSQFYLEGLGVHSGARLTYDLAQSYQRFQAELGIDDSAGGGSVVFRVLVDGKQKYASGPIRGGMAPVPISIDLHGIKRLELIVDYGERGDLLDHANWLNARLIK